MSSTYRIATADRAPEDPAKNTAFHQELIDRLNAELGHYEWKGSVFADYWRRDGYVAIAIEPGETPATLEDLRAFREEQRKAREAELSKPEQGSLI